MFVSELVIVLNIEYLFLKSYIFVPYTKRNSLVEMQFVYMVLYIVLFFFTQGDFVGEFSLVDTFWSGRRFRGQKFSCVIFSSHIAFHPTKSENNENYVFITQM